MDVLFRPHTEIGCICGSCIIVDKCPFQQDQHTHFLSTLEVSSSASKTLDIRFLSLRDYGAHSSRYIEVQKPNS